MALPWIIGGLAAAAAAAYLASDDDDSSSSYSDRDEREEETKRRAREEKREQKLEDIDDFINSQEVEMKKRYPSADIRFDLTERHKILMAKLEGKSVHVDIEKASSINILFQENEFQEEIYDIQEEISNLQVALKELKEIKNETFI